MASNFNNLNHYQQTILRVSANLTNLEKFCRQLGLDNTAASLDEMRQKMEEKTFQVSIIGEFKRGKSTLINALLGREVCPSDRLPATATLNRVTYGLTPGVTIEYKDGTSEEIGIDQMEAYVTKLTEDSEQKAATVKEAVVRYPLEYCKNNVDIIDTPGLNDDAVMTSVTLGVLPETDAAIYVILATSPFSETERDFLENKMMTSDLGRVIFVVNGMDYIDEDEREELLEYIGKRIDSYVMSKAKKVYGEDSEEFRQYKRKIGKPRVVGISAKQALKGKLKGDEALYQKSKFPELEQEIERLLTADRGAIAMSGYVGRMLSACGDISGNIQMRLGALNMDAEEFDKKYQEAQREFTEIREKRSEEMVKIDLAAQATWQEVKPMLQGFWPDVKGQISRMVEEEPLSNEDLSKENGEATQERMMQKVQSLVQNQSQLLSEQIQNHLAKNLEQETQRLEGFEDDFFQVVDRVQSGFLNFNQGGEITGTDQLIGTALSSFILMGAGGAYTGFKQAGWKGLLLGGGVGFAATYGITVATVSLLVAAGIASAPLLIIGSIASAFTGGKIADFVVKKLIRVDHTQKFRETFLNAVIEELDRMSRESDLEEKVREQIEAGFSAMKKNIRNETERVLQDLQLTLDQLKSQMDKSYVLAEKEGQMLEEISQETGKIYEYASEISRELAELADSES